MLASNDKNPPGAIIITASAMRDTTKVDNVPKGLSASVAEIIKIEPNTAPKIVRLPPNTAAMMT